MRIPFLTTAALAALLLGGCAAVQPGATREEAIARYGKPSREVPLASGTRLQYNGQPALQSNFMVDLDAVGRVASVYEALSPEGFARLVPGRSSRADVERELGRPASIDHVASWKGDIMTYRWQSNYQPMLFWVYLDPANTVQRLGEGMEFPTRFNDR
jgi:hypothetical protein